MESELEKLKIRVANLEAEQNETNKLIDRLIDELSKARLGRYHRSLLAEARLRLYLKSFTRPAAITVQEQMSKLVEQNAKSKEKRSRLFDW